jgi:predicted transcriptional regulator
MVTKQKPKIGRPRTVGEATVVSVRLPAAEYAKLAAVAAKLDRSLSYIARAAIREYTAKA